MTNWSAYDEGLRSGGSLTFWIEEAVLQSWYAAPRTTPGGQPIYADGAIEMILTLGMVYHLPLRQTEGFARSLLSLMDLSLPVPRHSTLSRRRKTLDIQPIKPSARGPIDIVLDGSGLKVFGAGEWCVEKHGKSRRLFADGAYDGDPVYETVRRYQADAEPMIIVPPRRTAEPSGNVDGPTERDRHIKMIREHGRMAWQKATIDTHALA
ncbi:MAG: transposase [Geminicoccaceae bacterium]